MRRQRFGPHRGRCSGRFSAAAALAAVVAFSGCGFRARLLVGTSDKPAQDGSVPMPAGFATLLQDALASLEPLKEQVNAGKMVPRFGEKSQQLLAAIEQPDLRRAVDSQLQALFLQQLILLRQQAATKFEKVPRPLEAVNAADNHFVAQAKELLRPDSDWSFEPERYALRAKMEGNFRRAAALAEERVRATQAQQSTMEIISKLQSQMESLQAKVQAMRAGGPWFLSTSYRIPNTPFQLIGRYQQGRASVELGLNQDRDPACAEAGFVSGLLGAANVGLTFNVGT